MRLALVYVGEGTFPTGKLRFSFFIYPLVTRLEQNTFPPREHKELSEKYPFARVADGTRFTCAEPQLGHARSLRSCCEAKSAAEPNHPSKRWPAPQSRSKTII